MAGLKDAQDGIARDDADDASAGNYRHLLHADCAHAIEQGKRGFLRRSPMKFVLGEHDGLHRSYIPILLRHGVQRFGRNQPDELIARNHQVRAAPRAYHFAGIVFE